MQLLERYTRTDKVDTSGAHVRLPLMIAAKQPTISGLIGEVERIQVQAHMITNVNAGRQVQIERIVYANEVRKDRRIAWAII